MRREHRAAPLAEIPARAAAALLGAALAASPAALALAQEPDCHQPVRLDALRATLDAAPARILGFEAAQTAEELRAVTRNLPCLDGPITAPELGRLWYLRGLSRLYATDEGKASRVGGEDVVLTFFSVAHRVDPTLTWSDAVYGDWGKEHFLMAVEQVDAAAAAHARGAAEWVHTDPIPADLDAVRLDGQPLEAGETPALPAGTFLVQWARDGVWHGAWVHVGPDDVSVDLPLPGPEATAVSPEDRDATELSEAGDEPADQAPPGREESPLVQYVDPEPEPSHHLEKAVRPPPERAPAVTATVLAGSWRVPQLYSGPEIGLSLGVGRLAVSAAVGAGIGPWQGCASCAPAQSTYVILPARLGAGVRLGRGGPAALELGLAWQAYLGGGFGALGEEPSPSAHGVDAVASLTLGRGRVRALVRLAGGGRVAPESLQGLDGSIGVGLSAGLGRER